MSAFAKALLAELAERHVLDALAVLDDELVRSADAGGLRALRLLARVDERDLEVRLGAHIRPQPLLDQLVQVGAARILGDRVGGELDRAHRAGAARRASRASVLRALRVTSHSLR